MKFHFIRSAPAKVNLGLAILNAENGYHVLDSLFTKVSLADELDVKISSENDFVYVNKARTLVCDLWPDRIKVVTIDELETIPKSPAWRVFLSINSVFPLEPEVNNTIIKVLQILQRQYLQVTHQTWFFYVNINKNIPIQAGLGGGSSDAATMFFIMQAWLEQVEPKPWQLDWSLLATKVGMDVPFFFVDKLARVRGYGEDVLALRSPLSGQILLFKPPFDMSTPEMYRRWDNLSLDQQASRPNIKALIATWSAGDLLSALEHSGNSFEAVLATDRPQYLALLRELAATSDVLAVHLSGSGSASWLIADNYETYITISSYLNQLGYWTCLAEY